MHCCALIVAAGVGRRLGAGRPKQFLPLRERPVLLWSVDAFARVEDVRSLVLVVAASELEPTRRLLERWRVDTSSFPEGVFLCAGGETRFESSQRGLAEVPDSATHVAIHDAARPLVSPELIARVLAAATEHGAALPVLPVGQTVKRVVDNRVTATVDRAELRLAQTPQIVERSLLERAYDGYDGGALTDDSQLVEQLGEPVAVVEGDPANFKITVAHDLVVAEATLAAAAGSRRRGRRTEATAIVDARERAAAPAGAATPGGELDLSRLPRTGFGFDVHQLEPGDAVILGGVEIPCGMRLVGHSDADVLAHAAGDALLGAAALGDLGAHFPPSDERWAGADSIDLLARIRALVAEAGYAVGNIDCVVVCEKPKLAPHIDAMRGRLAGALGVDAGRVAVKATTSERLGFTGRGEGIAAYATVLIVPTN